MNDGLLSKDQIASYFQKIQEGLKKEEEREAAAAAAASNNKPSFSIGTPGISKRSRGSAAATAMSNQQECNNKSPLFSSQCSPTPPPSSSSEEQHQQQPELSSSERCLALLGIKPTTIPPPQTQEQIDKSRLEREQEIMKQYEDLKQKAEAKAKLRPLIWAKPTFCPYGGEIKSDDDDDTTSSSSSSNNKTKKRSRSDDVEEPYAMSSQMTNLLSCSSSKRHNNMLRQACSNMYGMMPSSYSSSTYKTSWTKEEVDAFVEFTDKWILPPKKKKVKVDDRI